MENTDATNQFLPYGVNLRDVLQHPSISKNDLRQLLRIKGVFVDDVEDEVTFPLLTTTLLSPSEYEFIREKLQTKEDREKTIGRMLDWNSSNNLMTAIPVNFNVQEILKVQFPRYEVVGSPSFTMIDNNPNKVKMDFKCETKNYNKEWWRVQNEFRGQITLEKTEAGDKIKIEILHTSPETFNAADKVIKRLEKEFKDRGFVRPEAEVQKILYKDFSNEERINFFLSFTAGNDTFSFQRASLLDIGPVPGEDLPNDIQWMKRGNVKDLHINGGNLHEIDFIKDSDLHKYMELSQMEIIYKFDYHAARGECKINISFPGYFYKRSPTIELVVDIMKTEPDDEYQHVNVASVRSHLLKEFEKLKVENHNLIKKQQLAKNTIPT